jgi:predicted transcriptional regulator
MSWAMKIPKAELEDSSARHVLLVLANYAGSEGKGAFPSASKLSAETGLSERTVRYKLELLREAGWISRGNQAIAAVHIDQHDRRPVVYDLALDRGANTAPRSERGANDGTGCNQQQSGVQNSTERGAESAPNTAINHQVTEEQQQREISELIGQQDRQAIDDLDNRQRYAMHATWSPNSRYLIAQAQIAGVKPTEIPDSVVKSFMGFFAAKPDTVDSAAGWCRRLVSWFVRERAATAVSGTGSDEIEDDSTDWMLQVPK